MAGASTWAVRYTDGTVLASEDATHPAFVPDAGEVPFRAVDWARAEALVVRGPDRETAVPVPPADPGLAWSLRARTYARVQADAADAAPLTEAVRAYLLVLSEAGAPVTDATTRATVCVFPDGLVFHEAGLWGPDAARHAEAQLARAAAVPAPAAVG